MLERQQHQMEVAVVDMAHQLDQLKNKAQWEVEAWAVEAVPLPLSLNKWKIK